MPDEFEHLTIERMDTAYRVERDAIFEEERRLSERRKKNLAFGYVVRERRDRLAKKVTRMPPPPVVWQDGGIGTGAVRRPNVTE